MHHEAYEGFRTMLTASLVPAEELRYGLDVGGRNVNGSVREQLPGVEWKGMDIVSGPDVDIVMDASCDDWISMPVFDIIIATELFEHIPLA
jgi:predicted SAM-dependent methyltransferase